MIVYILNPALEECSGEMYIYYKKMQHRNGERLNRERAEASTHKAKHLVHALAICMEICMQLSTTSMSLGKSAHIIVIQRMS